MAIFLNSYALSYEKIKNFVSNRDQRFENEHNRIREQPETFTRKN